MPRRFAMSVVLAAAASLLAGSTLVAADAAAWAAALNSITAAELQRDAETLADDSLEGREAGAAGGRAAAKFLERELQALGLEPVAGGSYRQDFGRDYHNLIAVAPGSDPEVADQAILIGAHFDHVGYGTRRNSFGPVGYVHNGADDNASGVAVLLEVAEALAAAGPRPRRTVLFALWDAEEKGLLGSKHWFRNPTWPVDSVVASINLDMVGRLTDSRLEVYGWRASPGFRRLAVESNLDGLSVAFPWRLENDSDHYTFLQHGVPTVMLHTGLHDDYHRPSDDVDKLNIDGMAEVARLAVRLAYALANDEVSPAFRRAAFQESESDRDDALSVPPRLGIRFRTDGDGALVTGVYAGTPAAQAGLRTGMRILQVNDLAFETDAEFGAIIAQAPTETKMIVVKQEGAEPSEFTIRLAGEAAFRGATFVRDAGDPAAAVAARVATGSPSDAAGLRAGDRIWSWAGVDVSQPDWTSKVAQAGEPAEVVFERDGQEHRALVAATLPAAERGDEAGEQIDAE